MATDICQYSTTVEDEPNVKLSNFKLLELPLEIQYYTNIICMRIVHSNLKCINILPPQVESVSLHHNEIEKIDCVFPNSLRNLDVTGNCITHLFTHNSHIQQLCCRYNNITRITLSSMCFALEADNNPIQHIDFTSHLRRISLSHCKLNEVPNLPNSVVNLNLAGNMLTNIDTIPDTVRSLNVNGNKIKECKKWPTKLEWVYLSGNEFTHLDNLPDSVKIIHCSGNYIEKIHHTHPQLEHITCHNNPLKSLTLNGKTYIICNMLWLLNPPVLLPMQNAHYFAKQHSKSHTEIIDVKMIPWHIIGQRVLEQSASYVINNAIKRYIKQHYEYVSNDSGVMTITI